MTKKRTIRRLKPQFSKKPVVKLPRLPYKKLGLLVAAWALGTLLIVQIFYPADKMLPFDRVDGVMVGGKSRAEAAALLDKAYGAKTIDIYLGDRQKPVSSTSLAAAGLVAHNAEWIAKYDYPWFVRLVPSSIFWASAKQSAAPFITTSAKTDEFLTTKLLKECQVAPVDATLKAEGDKLVVVDGKNGGECDAGTVKKEFTAVKPVLTKPASVRITMKELPFSVTGAEAKHAAELYMEQIADGARLKVNEEIIKIAPQDFYAWLDFEPEGDYVEAHVNAEKAKDYLAKNVTPKVAIAPGTATVTTRDFEEISRTGGSDGQTLNLDATVKSLDSYLHGLPEFATAITQAVPANITYVRTYSSSDAGLNALLTNYAKDHKGTFGIAYAEMSGNRRRASYNGDKKFVTASTYKLFVAYSVLKRVEAGQMSWDENQACFNKMISNSDNACAEMFLNKVGLKTVTSEINKLGLKDSNFIEQGGPFTTANDLVIFLGTLEGGSMFSGTSRERLVSVMLGNVYRSGIPAGASGQVADKVGFMDGLLHDAAIVYSPKGTYVLAVMSDGSTWGTIADLTRELEKIR